MRIASHEQTWTAGDLLVMDALRRVVLYEPEEMIIMCEAGLPLSELNALLKSKNQWIPTLFDFHQADDTVGSALARGRKHPRARAFSPLATVVLGGTFSTASGELFRSGSRVVKSVAGYDTHRAFVGSRGKFGAIIEVTLKVQPLPESFFRFSTGADLEALHEFQCSLIEPGHAGNIVEVCGFNEDVDHSRQQLKAAGLPYQELGPDWESFITQTQVQRSGGEQALVERLQRAFDPERVLQ